MFRKPFKVKSNTSIRGSQRRKLKEAVAKLFPNIAENVLSVIPNNEDITVMKLLTFSEEDITCYTLNKNPIFFEKDGLLVPTVYTLWQFPNMIGLSFGTSPFAFEKLTGGADLFMNGVTHISHDSSFGNRSLCSIHVGENRGAVGVGITEFSYEQIVSNGREGKKVRIFHLFEDNLWSYGDKSKLPFIELMPPADNVGESEHLASGNDISSSCDAHSEDTSTSKTTENVSSDNDGTVDEETISDIDNASREIEQKSPQELTDELLVNCFCQAMIDAKKTPLPILVSTFTSQFLYPVCPEGSRIDVKKSSYKKMSKFLASMQEKGVIQVKELSKGVDSVVAMNLENVIIFEYRKSEFATAVKLLRELKLKEDKLTAKENSKQVFVVEMYAVSGKTLPFFKIFDISKGATLLANDVRKYLGDYVRTNNLVDQKSKKLVTLDPLLTDILCNKNNIVETMTWDAIMKRMLSEMNDCYELSLPNRKPLVKKGKVKCIEICIEQRMGNKKVTILKNLDEFGIDLKQFAVELQHVAASSTSLIDGPGKTNSQYIQVQGLQHKHIKTVLETYQIPRKYIVGLDNTASGKSKKK